MYGCKKKKQKEEENEEKRAREWSLHRFEGRHPLSPREKMDGGKKRRKKKGQESRARPNPMKTFRVIVNSSTRQSTTLLSPIDGR